MKNKIYEEKMITKYKNWKEKKKHRAKIWKIDTWEYRVSQNKEITNADPCWGILFYLIHKSSICNYGYYMKAIINYQILILKCRNFLIFAWWLF